jgi:hypothetical protein
VEIAGEFFAVAGFGKCAQPHKIPAQEKIPQIVMKRFIAFNLSL